MNIFGARDRYDDIEESLLLPDLDDDCNPIVQTAAERAEAIVLALKLSLDYCDTCHRYMIPASHVCDGDNRVIWP